MLFSKNITGSTVFLFLFLLRLETFVGFIPLWDYYVSLFTWVNAKFTTKSNLRSLKLKFTFLFFIVYNRLLRTDILNVIRIISQCKILLPISLIMQNINLGLK